ncbi:M15 family metallopeptidase [Mycetocola sp. JXN-3]|uniref:M15 family metallopeptidase n=1 Tax=Mycetocola sp. JXN-3 TaxID=2116510 RepID=UPI00165D0EC9|nr:M15 family metallopeptidase [Mycetocola sp. JXN-3]
MITLISAPSVANIPVEENGEALVELADFGVRCRPNIGAGSRVRFELARRLRAADQALPVGFHLCVAEGLRPVETQRAIIETYLAALRIEFPEADAATLDELSARYVAPVSVAPHVAGAAVDLTLVNDAGIELDMGTVIDATPEESAGAVRFAAKNISVSARANRELLARALGAAGLENYPHEWWHWSYGDRYWAHLTGAAHAVYGPVAD